MCGIAGLVDVNQRLGGEALGPVVGRMTDTLVHRGPDDRGVWSDATVGVALGHRRLSILDLSPEGHQPMASACGRYVIVFNGEIYNHHAIRQELERAGAAPAWRGHSDTEVMLAAVRHWGIDAALRRFVGMFAFALWDREQRVLTLARDRVGEKPLYYGWLKDGNFVFGSELKALRAHPAWAGDIDRGALTLFLRHNYVPAPYSIYQGIHKLPPGTTLQLPLDRLRSETGRTQTPQPYWTVRECAESGHRQPFTGSDDEAVQQLDELLRAVIRDQMVADVPLGAFLSGGIDSTTVVALMQAQSARPVKTFTVGFAEAGYNEAEHAKAVARHLGTEHTELYVSPEEAMAAIPRLPQLYDEPFSDSSQIPTFLIAQLARRHVSVSLSGDAGDESFAGYNRYVWAQGLWSRMRRIPLPLRRALMTSVTAISPPIWDRIAGAVMPLMPKRLRVAAAGDKLHKLCEILDATSAPEIYFRLVSHWKQPASLVIDGMEPATLLAHGAAGSPLGDFTLDMMYWDQLTYLPDDILVKVDRAAMGVSLETRVPFLDHRLIEFAWRLPLALKYRGGEGKWILRRVLDRYVPRPLMARPKMGFGVPIGDWLRGPLRDWAETLLAEERLRRDGFFHVEPIRAKWREHLSGRRQWQYYLWDILMFQAWQASQ